ncbi:MAG: [FeFe] hydrogenase H-cluster radical SAM maturase HydE [Oscillospiraceae bacterium]|jgi:biotin synthase|nr:[FeFe] hydrogenase H-cluster radical SAM maturase HydE [Oscillospiraceae bacterium]
MTPLIKELKQTGNLPDLQLKQLLQTDDYNEELFAAADEVRRENYGTDVYIRGLIEFSNFCTNNCYYCGIRSGNTSAQRYRLTIDEIFECAQTGYALGFRTFVLQSGEDDYFSDDIICEIVSGIKKRHPDCAVTLSVGEKPYESYLRYFNAGADRYLLRHETASQELYSKLHPGDMSLTRRLQCLHDLKKIGYQTGSGFMVGVPFQTAENLIEDLRFLQELQPHMIGIGPFLRHAETPFKNYENGGFLLTLKLIAILRLMFPRATIPATTALGTVAKNGREQGLKCGANVVMPNLSPLKYRKLYTLYDDKICTGEEAAECVGCLRRRVESAGYKIVVDRGDSKVF